MTVLKSTTTTTYEQSHPSTPYPPPNEKLPSYPPPLHPSVQLSVQQASQVGYPPPPSLPQHSTAPPLYSSAQPSVQQASQVVGYPPPPPLPQHPTALPNQWTTGLCDCLQDPATCMLTWCCPFITFGQIAEIADRGYTSCASSGLVYALILYCLGCPCCYSCFYRTKLRSEFNLPEDPCGDCLVHCFCEPCALCQEYREFKNRGFDPALGWAGNVARQQRQQGVPMTPPLGQAMHK